MNKELSQQVADMICKHGVEKIFESRNLAEKLHAICGIAVENLVSSEYVVTETGKWHHSELCDR